MSKLNQIVSTNGKRSLMHALGNEIKAITGGGKEFFTFDSNVAEPIKWVVKRGKSTVYSAGEYIFNIYEIGSEDVKDVFQFSAPSEILSCVNGQFVSEGSYYTILCCKVIKLKLLPLNSKL